MQSDGQLHSNVFYNGTVEVVEPSGILSGENAFLALLAIALLGLLGYWAYGQVQKLTKVSSPCESSQLRCRFGLVYLLPMDLLVVLSRYWCCCMPRLGCRKSPCGVA
jgi:hypothetical protein